MATAKQNKSSEGEDVPPVVVTVESPRYDEKSRRVGGVGLEYDAEYEMFGVITQAGTFLMFPRDKVYEVQENNRDSEGSEGE